MKKPKVIEFDRKCLRVLKSTLLARTPEEGCALLIGKRGNNYLPRENEVFRVHVIWPCCNIWSYEKFKIISQKPQEGNQEGERTNIEISKKNRFLIDPREQIVAQQWARGNHLIVLGDAHSHPIGKAIPSRVDSLWSTESRLMVIIDSEAAIRAWWWEKKNQRFESIEISYFGY